MNALQCEFFKSAFRRYMLSPKFIELKNVRASASVLVERVRVEAKKNTPSLEVISDLRQFMCDVVALSFGIHVEANRFYKNCSVDVWSVMSNVVNTKNENERIRLLTGLYGVGVKTATYILSVIYPSSWGYVADPGIYYSAHIGFVQWEKNYFQIISSDDAIEVNQALLKISKQTGIEVADLSSAMFVLFFYAYKNGFRSGTGKKYGVGYE
ncbi:hypothetical protein CBP51_15105 [Cellvibrio mixtus]|uniref:Uncharacterized protein n=1 Tax=Cellvibrio mixtus TaxID=39650 RepID=A0A266Q561_9GAMM|nr:hypothetical protein [Cellvibrio mixtus]OZY84521.1 hypothetical protein CBP51_15105 [Cellvibrio mixtus]